MRKNCGNILTETMMTYYLTYQRTLCRRQRKRRRRNKKEKMKQETIDITVCTIVVTMKRKKKMEMKMITSCSKISTEKMYKLMMTYYLTQRHRFCQRRMKL